MQAIKNGNIYEVIDFYSGFKEYIGSLVEVVDDSGKHYYPENKYVKVRVIKGGCKGFPLMETYGILIDNIGKYYKFIGNKENIQLEIF